MSWTWAEKRARASRHARMMRGLDERDVGIRSDLYDKVAALIEEPLPVCDRHYVTSRSKRTACGLTGVYPHTFQGTDFRSQVTCAKCKAVLAKRAERKTRRP